MIQCISSLVHPKRIVYDASVIRDLTILFIHLLVTIARLFRPGGVRSIVAESLLVKHQLLILNRSRKRAPSLKPVDRLITGLCAIFVKPNRLLRSSIILKPSSILEFPSSFVKTQISAAFHTIKSSKGRGKNKLSRNLYSLPVIIVKILTPINTRQNRM